MKSEDILIAIYCVSQFAALVLIFYFANKKSK